MDDRGYLKVEVLRSSIRSNAHFQLADFGFAKRIEHYTYTLCGTPDYFSPELIQSKGFGICRPVMIDLSLRPDDLGHGKPTDWWTLGARAFDLFLSGLGETFMVSILGVDL